MREPFELKRLGKEVASIANAGVNLATGYDFLRHFIRELR